MALFLTNKNSHVSTLLRDFVKARLKTDSIQKFYGSAEYR